MNQKDVYVVVTFRSVLRDETKGNCFTGLPNDLLEFLEKSDGTMTGIIESLEPGRLYNIEISVRSE